MVRTPNKPHQQVIRRLSERAATNRLKDSINVTVPQASKKHLNGPLFVGLIGEQYGKLALKNFTLCTDKMIALWLREMVTLFPSKNFVDK